MAAKKPFGGKKAAPFVKAPAGSKNARRRKLSSTKTAKGMKK